MGTVRMGARQRHRRATRSAEQPGFGIDRVLITVVAGHHGVDAVAAEFAAEQDLAGTGGRGGLRPAIVDPGVFGAGVAKAGMGKGDAKIDDGKDDPGRLTG